MADLDFPNSPVDGQSLNGYTYDTGVGGWVYTAGSAAANNETIRLTAAFGAANAANGWANTTQGYSQSYTNAVGTAANSASVTRDGYSNNWANTVGTSGNIYATAVGTAGNTYATAVGAAANTWANTKLSNTAGVSFAGNLFFPTGNVGIGTSSYIGYSLDVQGATRLGGTTIDSSGIIEINATGTGNRYAYIDFHGDDTYTDFGLRIIRQNSGPNSVSQIVHRGTSALQISASEAGNIEFYTNSVLRMLIDNSGSCVTVGRQSTTEGGELRLQIPTSGTTLAGDIAFDSYNNQLRIFENGGGFRGFYLDVSAGANSAATQILHENVSGIRKLIAEWTANNSASLSDTNILNQGYTSYEIEFLNILPATNGALAALRPYISGAYQSGASYYSSGIIPSNYFWYNNLTYIGLSWTGGVLNTAADGGLNGSIRVSGTSLTASYKHFYGTLSAKNNGSSVVVPIVVSGYYPSTAAVTGFQFLFTSGNITSGTIRIYGLK
jgi:hypothetical protein